jgi:5-methyltetrahydrofolate--homocysteine methyltransferase
MKEVNYMFDFGEIRQALESGNAPQVKKLTEAALGQGVSAKTLLNEGLIAAMSEVGEKFKRSEVYVPEVLVAARAMYAGLDILRPILVETGAKAVGKLVIGTVKGDLHDIGKNLVRMMFEGAGFHVVDLGIDVPDSKFVDAVRTESPDLLGMSALLTTTMPAMKTTIEALEDAGLRDKVKVIVGGAPVTQHFADAIGADGYAPDASSAVDLAKELIG